MASSTTTSAPRRRQTLPSSSPMTPAPITPRRFGTASNSSAPQESTIALPSNGTDLSSIGTEPVASTTCFAASSCFAPSSAVYSTRLPASSLPCPCNPVTPAALNSAVMPWVEALTIFALRFCIVATSKPRPPTWMPCAANSACARWYSSDDSSSAFEGMQPAFRQVPPKAWLPS